MNIFKKGWCRFYQSAMRFGMLFLNWRQPRLITGENSFENAVQVLAEQGVSCPLVVCDKAALERHALDGFFQKAQGMLQVVVYDGVLPNPTVSQVEDGLEIYHKNNCNGILAFGGGSAMDCAKAIGARVVRPRKTVNQMKGLLKVGKKLPTFFAVPTTAGTGSECTVAAVITDSQTHDKYAINDPALIPHFAILDPTLTVGLPPFLTATTGMDALTHAVEAYIGRSNTKHTKVWAEEATTLVFENLLQATQKGDLQARSQMQKAAYLAGLAFTRAYVGYVHAIAHALGGKYGIAHGLANAVILPVVLEKFGKSAQKPLARLAKISGVAQSADSNTLAAQKFISAIKQLNQELGIPSKLSGVQAQDIAELAKHAAREANPLYPVPQLWTERDFAEVIERLI